VRCRVSKSARTRPQRRVCQLPIRRCPAETRRAGEISIISCAEAAALLPNLGQAPVTRPDTSKSSVWTAHTRLKQLSSPLFRSLNLSCAKWPICVFHDEPLRIADELVAVPAKSAADAMGGTTSHT
jgi:hypothetical protein